MSKTDLEMISWQLDYHKENPHIYDLFRSYALKFISLGYKHAGAKQILEVMRWETAVKAKRDIFKIDNSITAFYARLFMSQHPEHKGFFRTRVHKKDESGTCNQD